MTTQNSQAVEAAVQRLMELADTFCNASDSVAQMLGANAGMDEGNVYWIEMKRARAALETALRAELTSPQVAAKGGTVSESIYSGSMTIPLALVQHIERRPHGQYMVVMKSSTYNTEFDDYNNAPCLDKDEGPRFLTAWCRYRAELEAATLRDLSPAKGLVPEGFALVPLRMTQEMHDVTDEEGWQWEDVLAAAGTITPEQYDATQAPSNAVPVAVGEPSKYGSPEMQSLILSKLATPAAQGDGREAGPYSGSVHLGSGASCGVHGRAVVSAYSIQISDKPFAEEITVQRMRQIDGTPLWSVKLGGNCLNKSGEWEWEPMPSSRDDEFLARCRFESPEAAIDAAMNKGTT